MVGMVRVVSRKVWTWSVIGKRLTFVCAKKEREKKKQKKGKQQVVVTLSGRVGGDTH